MYVNRDTSASELLSNEYVCLYLDEKTSEKPNNMHFWEFPEKKTKHCPNNCKIVIKISKQLLTPLYDKACSQLHAPSVRRLRLKRENKHVFQNYRLFWIINPVVEDNNYN